LEKPVLPHQNLSQLYRFCFLMLGDAARALEIFQTIMHEAVLRAAQGEVPKNRLALFREARHRCLQASEAGLQAEDLELEEHPIDPKGAEQIKKLEPLQLAIWISAAPDPQRTALALFYLDDFTQEELLDVTELKTPELGKLIGSGRQEFQAWLDVTVPHEENQA
jgi:DNA-directed RNA polymerase specialized sigma24 family protein